MREYTVNIVLAIESLIILGTLILALPKQDPAEKKPVTFRQVACSFFAALICYFLRTFFTGRSGVFVFYLLWIVTTIEELLCAVNLPLLIYYLRPAASTETLRKHVRIMGAAVVTLSAGVIALVMINPLNHWLFTMKEVNRMAPGPIGYLPETVAMIQITLLTIMAVSAPQAKIRRIPVLVIFMIILSGLTALYINPEILMFYPLSVLSLLLVYVNIIDQREQNLRRRQVELNKNRISLLIGQIQPHFVFNVLNTIYYLCDSDPNTAADAAAHLRMYLQNNFEERFTEEPISFEKELGIVRHYTDLEKLRFEQIEIIYDIKDIDFSIPALTVQPLVENAIRHGLREMPQGRVVISSRKENKVHIVEVTDNGVGFRQADPNDGRRHVGIENAQRRLNMMSDATLEIFTPPQGGTVARIMIQD